MTARDLAGFNDVGKNVDEHPEMWSLLLDNGYHEALEVAGAVTPRRKTPRSGLPMEDQRHDTRVAHDIINVENSFGSYRTLKALLGAEYRLDERSRRKVVRIFPDYYSHLFSFFT